MDYPQWHLPQLGGGMLIALVAIVHVVIAHLAVGAGLFNAVTETWARRRGDDVLLAFLRRNSKFIILLPFIAGAVTGVGIWFTISVFSPRATSLLIHVFVWAWAVEWIFFFVEIAAGYIYYTTWDTLSPRRHVLVGWIYAGASWMSLVVITGIIGFMLTPGDWLESRSVWDGFFNPTFWPSLVIRSIAALATAGLGAMIVVNLQRSRVVEGSDEPLPEPEAPHDKGWNYRLFDRHERLRVVRYAALYLVPLVLMVPCGLWWFHHVPLASRNLAVGGAITMQMFFLFAAVVSAILGVYALFAVAWRGLYVNLPTSLTLAALAFLATGAMEFVREGIRKPWLVNQVLYVNQYTPDEGAAIDRDGFFARGPDGHHAWARFAAWGRDADALSALERGRLIYAAQCAACHHEQANAVGPLIRGWQRETIAFNLDRLHELKSFMPPLFGNDRDRADLAEYLIEEVQKRDPLYARAGE